MRKTLTIENKTHFLINPYHNLITWPAPVPTTRFEPTAILLGDKCTYHQAKVETNLSYKTIVTNHDPILGRFFTKNLCYARYYHNDCLFKNFLHIRGQRSFLKHVLTYWAFLKGISKNCCWYFLANLWKNWATLNFDIWTHLSFSWPNFGQMTRNEFQGWSTTINATPAPRMIETRPQCPSSHR